MRAYLDIETDRKGKICVIGLLVENNGFIQWYGDNISTESIERELSNVKTIVTFNGDLFDLPQIKKCLN
ncbi:MAG TPA: ribonuclease H-like domain-containing protein, partial [Syntrophorhabdaceae bacterium]|nr:ribonuclease H-like domain-containing protein [Syntrophorhabdaceae bacterium]